MNDFKTEYKKWLNKKDILPEIREELSEMDRDEAKIYEAFYQDLRFGTAGLRGIMGAGTNRMNIYVIGKVTQGLADYMNENFREPSAAIAYDSRNNSRFFAQTAAGILSANNIKTYIYKELMPVSALSFAVRELACDMGIMITASHNPKEYNGYKVYRSDGCQILGSVPQDILDHIEKVDIFGDVRTADFNDALKKNCSFISEKTEKKYIDKAFGYSLGEDLRDLRLVYTPLNGTGKVPVCRILEKGGLKDIHLVEEQKDPDGDFPTCPYPNPEIPEIYDLASKRCDEAGGDLILATDPDCDRVGIAEKNGGDLHIFSGNQIAVLLFDYICRKKKLPQDAVAVRTIVSTRLADQIARENGVRIEKTLVGFKYIGEKIRELEDGGKEESFIFGFEEGNGFLPGSYVRDKDGVSTALLVCQMAASHKAEGRSLTEALEELYRKYGFYREKVLNYVFEGSEGVKKISGIMDFFRNSQRESFLGERPSEITDYREGSRYMLGDCSGCVLAAGSRPTGLPRENVMGFSFRSGREFIVRPSGTEPKLKIYLFSAAADSDKAEADIEKMEREIKNLINK